MALRDVEQSVYMPKYLILQVLQVAKLYFSEYNVYVHKQNKTGYVKKLIITGRLKSMWTPSMRQETEKKGLRKP